MKTKLEYEVIKDIAQLEEIVDLQKLVWGDDVVTSLPQMVASIHNGGVVIGAVEKENQRIVGFCYGFAGVSKPQNKPYLYSHMAAIHPDYQNQGIGRKLKFNQRQWAIDFGYEKITWTFDPLEVRNGFLNLCKLGGCVRTYIPSYYGHMNDKLNKGLPSDRFLVEWDLNSKTAVKASNGVQIHSEDWAFYSQLLDCNAADNLLIPGTVYPTEGHEGYLLGVPKDIQKLKQLDMELVKNWRMIIRNIVTQAFSNDYYISGLLCGKDSVHYYVLEKIK